MSTPSSTSVAQGWCLRFRSGAMNGRTLALKAGANVVGSSGECDIMLPGNEVLPRHLALSVGELVVSLQKIGTASASLNGEPLSQARRSLVAGDIVAVGQMELQLERSSPSIEPHDPMFVEHDAVPDIDGSTQAIRTVPRPMTFWAGAALLVVAAIALLGMRTAGSSLYAARDTPPDLTEVEQAIAPFSEVEVMAATGGQLAIRGFVESRLRRQALQQRMQEFGDQITVRVYAADELVEQAQRYIGAPGVAISYAGKGRIVASGTADQTVREKVRRLSEDLHPAVIVLDKVQYQVPTPTEDKERERAKWAAWQEVLPARLVSITTGPDGVRSIQLANGSRYYEGAVLKSGVELQRIDVDGLVLSAGNSADAMK